MTKNALALFLFAASAGLCQTQDKPDTLQALLTEVHQLRQAIQTMTVASQRVQIALYSLQMQDAAVARESVRFDAVHEKCVAGEAQRQKLASDIQTVEGELSAGTVSPDVAKALQVELRDSKRLLESKSTEVQLCQAAEVEASSRFRNEQSGLADLKERIQRLDQGLEKAAGADK